MTRITVARGESSLTSRVALRITVRMRVGPIRAAILGAALLVLGGGVAAQAITALRFWSLASSGALPVPELLGLGVSLVLILLVVARLAWLLIGRETFIVTPSALSVRRSIGPLALSRTFRSAEAIGLDAGELSPWKRMGLGNGRRPVVLRHHDRFIRMARDLDKAEGAYLLSTMRIWMQEAERRETSDVRCP